MPPRRALLGSGAVVAGVASGFSLLAGVTGNWIANLEVPGFFGTTAGAFVAFAVATVITVVFGIAAARSSGSKKHAAEDPGPGAPVLAIVGGDGSADRRFSIWSMSEFTADLATVHTAIGRRSLTDVGASQLEHLPPYVERDHDPSLIRDVVAAAAGQLEALILLQGASSTGKTRSLYEAVRTHCGNFQVVRPHNMAALRALPLSGHLSQAPTVLWLNELQGFLGPNGTGLTRSLLSDLYAAADFPLVTVGTLWPEKLRTATDRDDEGTRDTRDLLSERVPDVRWHLLPERLTSFEEARARTVASRDERVAKALIDRERFGFTQTLAGAHDVLYQYRTGRATTRIILEAAADARRLGVQSALPAPLLRAIALALWADDRGPSALPGDWFPKALSEAAEPIRSDDGVRALIPLADPVDTFTLADYLEQYLIRSCGSRIVSDSVWAALRDCAATPDLLRIAQEARRRARYAIERDLINRAKVCGEPQADDALRRWKRRRHGPENDERRLRRAIANNQQDANMKLALWLERRHRKAEAERALRDAIEAGETGARVALADRLSSHGNFDEVARVYRDAVNDGDPKAREALAHWYSRHRRTDDAERTFREAVDAGETRARQNFVEWLRGQEREQEAQMVLREAFDAGEPDSCEELTTMLAQQGRYDEAERVCREAIDSGDDHAYTTLARHLYRRGRVDEAEQALLSAIDAGITPAQGSLMRLLRRHGRPDDADKLVDPESRRFPHRGDRRAAGIGEKSDETESGLREAAIEGKPLGYRSLARSLERQGRGEQARQAYREGIAAREPGSYIAYARWLATTGAHEDAVETYRAAIAARESGAYYRLADYLDGKGCTSEAEQVHRDAVEDGGYFAAFAVWLNKRERFADAEIAYREGVRACQPLANYALSIWLDRRGRADEAERALRDAVVAGEVAACEALVEWLDKHERHEEASIVRRTGLNAEGRTAGEVTDPSVQPSSDEARRGDVF